MATLPMMAMIGTGNVVLARGFTQHRAIHDEHLALRSDNQVGFNNRIRQAWPKNVEAIEVSCYVRNEYGSDFQKAVAATLTDPVRDTESQRLFIQLEDIDHQIMGKQHMLESYREALEEQLHVLPEAENSIADLIENYDRAARSSNRNQGS